MNSGQGPDNPSRRPPPSWARPRERGEALTNCRGCQAPILWRLAPCAPCSGSGLEPCALFETLCHACGGRGSRPHPIDPAGGSHFASCPRATRFRDLKRRRKAGRKNRG